MGRLYWSSALSCIYGEPTIELVYTLAICKGANNLAHLAEELWQYCFLRSSAQCVFKFCSERAGSFIHLHLWKQLLIVCFISQSIKPLKRTKCAALCKGNWQKRSSWKLIKTATLTSQLQWTHRSEPGIRFSDSASQWESSALLMTMEPVLHFLKTWCNVTFDEKMLDWQH